MSGRSRAHFGTTLRAELVGAGGVVERNFYLTRRYLLWDVAWFLWTVANTLTIVFIAKGIEASGGQLDVNREATSLLVGAVIWAYLGVLFEFLMETVAWERWEGTIEYTFMAPLSRSMHFAGMGVFAVLYGLLRAVFLFTACAFFFDLSMPDAQFGAAFLVLFVALVLVHRHRRDDLGAAADLAGEGDAARVHRAGDAPRRLRCLLPGQRPARVDAVDLGHLPGDVRARGMP
jgi:hypothetical protein